jgi:hypothetical protein
LVVTLTPNGVTANPVKIQHRRAGHDFTAQRASASK